MFLGFKNIMTYPCFLKVGFKVRIVKSYTNSGGGVSTFF